MILLESLQFFGGGSDRFIGLRRNATEPVSVPEWRLDVSRRPPDAPVAVTTAPRTATLAVTARFRSTGGGPSSFEVRAEPVDGAGWPDRPTWLPHPQLLALLGYWFPDVTSWLAYVSLYLRWRQSFEQGKNLLGTVAPTSVVIGADGASGPVRLPLVGSRASALGVAMEDVTWRWLGRAENDVAWTTLALTSFRVFSILGPPTAPWSQSAASPADFPWTEVLEHACVWADGTQTPEDAAAAVARAVNALGPERFQYGCAIGAMTMYAAVLGLELFDCTAVLERLAGGLGNGPYVNCSDCAAIVSTFSNALGCDLWQSRMGSYVPAFETQPIRAIGHPAFETPCGWGLGFTYHEVAWTGGCDDDDAVFDACLEFLQPDGNSSIVPTNLVFGAEGDNLYRDRIAAPQSRVACRPRPQERRRRGVL